MGGAGFRLIYRHVYGRIVFKGKYVSWPWLIWRLVIVPLRFVVATLDSCEVLPYP